MGKHAAEQDVPEPDDQDSRQLSLEEPRYENGEPLSEGWWGHAATKADNMGGRATALVLLVCILVVTVFVLLLTS